jgi:glycosyltransferase involved in cell wall biosynthesis
VTIYSGIDFKLFRKNVDVKKMKRDLNLAEDACLFGTVTRLDPIKGNDILIEAMGRVLSRHPSARLLIVGDGSEETKLKEQCQSLNISDKVIFSGYCSNVSDFIHVMDVFVLPSFNEGMGRVIVEAMACGKPVIASRVGGIPELVNDGEDGMLVPVRDQEALARAMASFAEDREKAVLFGQRGREKVCAPLTECGCEKFSVEHSLHCVERLYKTLLNGS